MTQVFISFKNTINGNPTKDSILAKKLYDYFNNCLRDLGLNVKEGIFGADMSVSLINQGPFTIVVTEKDL